MFYQVLNGTLYSTAKDPNIESLDWWGNQWHRCQAAREDLRHWKAKVVRESVRPTSSVPLVGPAAGRLECQEDFACKWQGLVAKEIKNRGLQSVTGRAGRLTLANLSLAGHSACWGRATFTQVARAAPGNPDEAGSDRRSPVRTSDSTFFGLVLTDDAALWSELQIRSARTHPNFLFLAFTLFNKSGAPGNL